MTRIMKMILGETGENVHIEPDFWCDYGYRLKACNPYRVIRQITEDDSKKDWNR